MAENENKKLRATVAANVAAMPAQSTLVKAMNEAAQAASNRLQYSNGKFTTADGLVATIDLTDHLANLEKSTSPYTAMDGTVLGAYDSYVDYVATPGIGDALNSNVQQQTKTGIKWAQQTKLTSDGKVATYDKVDMYAEDKKKSYADTPGTLAGALTSTAIIGSTAVSLGKTISSSLYNLYPNFWDSLNWQAMDPETWEETLIDAPNGEPTFSDLAMMALFQLDYNGKSATQYISDYTFAFVARGLAKLGLLDPPQSAGTGDDRDVASLSPAMSISGDIEYKNIYKNLTVYTVEGRSTVVFDFNNKADTETKTKGVGFKVTNNTDYDVFVVFLKYTDSDGVARVCPICLKNPEQNTAQSSDIYWYQGTVWLNGDYRWLTRLYGSTTSLTAYRKQWPEGTFPDSTEAICYVNGHALAPKLDESYTTDMIASEAADGVSFDDFYYLNATIWEILKTVSKSKLPSGVGNQTGATQLTEDEVNELKNDATTNDRAVQILKGRFTDLWKNRLETNTVQKDGSVKTTTWINVGNANEYDENNNPIVNENYDKGTKGSLQSSTKANFNENQVKQDEAADKNDITAPSVLNTILNAIKENINQDKENQATEGSGSGASKPSEPYEKPTDVNPGNTGTGVTPPVVIPSGSGGALFTVYNPSETEIKAFGAWMWSSDLIDQLKKLFSDPMQAVIGLHKVFIPPLQGGEDTIQVGYLDSGVTSTVVRQQYSQVNCGSVDVPEFFGNVFDYAPHTRIQLYLPFIGIVDLDPADVMRSTITVKYMGDAYTGACVANVYVKRDGNECCLYTFNGDTAVRYPISSGSYLGLASGVIGTVTSLAVGMTNPIFGAAGVLNSIGSMRTNVKHAGNLGGAPGAMGIKYPYLIITRPQTATATNFQKYVGKPANVLALVSQCGGFTRIEGCQVSNINEATQEEKDEIEKLLSSGFLA